MKDLLIGLLMLIGAGFMLVAAVGILRMPDLFLRLSAATKAATLGLASTLLATAIFFEDIGITTRALATIVFVFLTAPVAGHMIGRAAYFAGTPMWPGTKVDELRGQYNRQEHTLGSNLPSAPGRPPGGEKASG